MTRDEAIKKLDAFDAGDPEGIHGEADDVLLDFLLANGFSDVAEAYRRARERIYIYEIGEWTGLFVREVTDTDYAEHPTATEDRLNKIVESIEKKLY